MTVSRVLRATGLGVAACALPFTALALSIQNLTPGDTVPVGTALTFSVAGASSSTTFYVSDTFSGSSVDNTKINSSGAFNWTPLIQDIGAHSLAISTYDASGTSASITQGITVVPRLRVLIQSLSPGATVNPGQAVTFTATAAGLSSPTFSIVDAFAGGTLSISTINTISGIFNWTPTAADIGTHKITVTAADSSYNNASVTQQIVVAGATTSTPALTTTAPLPGTQSATPISTPPVTAPTLAPAYTFTSYLKVGSTGDEVTALQNLLIRDGYYSGAATGYYGSLTAAAVVRYQSAHGLDALGVVGPATRAALNAEAGGGTSSASAPTVAATVSSNAGTRLQIIQQLIAQLQQMQVLLIQLESVNN